MEFSFSPLHAPAQSLIESTQSQKAESLLITTQMALLRDFDSQMREVGRQIKLLGEVKRASRENIARLQEFLVQNTDDSRKDGKRCIKAKAEQLSALCGSFTRIDYDLNKMTFESVPLSFSGNGESHDLDQPRSENGKPWIEIINGKYSSEGLRDFFAEISSFTESDKAFTEAKTVGDDDSNLLFYFGHTDNRDENGLPLFNVYVDNLDRILEKSQGELSNLEEKSEELGVKFNQLGVQRKEALEGLSQILNSRKQLAERVLQEI